MDEYILLLINGWHYDWLDPIMSGLTYRFSWIPFYVALAFAVFKTMRTAHAILFFIAIALAITLSDQICASLIRPIFQRLRPSNLDNPLSAMIHIVDGYRGGSYGMPSCHSANAFALVTMLALKFRTRILTIVMVLWALMLCYTRMYLGVHYPTDLLVGAIMGTCCASLAYIIYRCSHNRIFHEECPQTYLSHTIYPYATMAATIFTITLFSFL